MISLNNSTNEYEIVEDEQLQEMLVEDVQEKDKATQLAEGLSNATTISQIRSVAKSVLEVGE